LFVLLIVSFLVVVVVLGNSAIAGKLRLYAQVCQKLLGMFSVKHFLILHMLVVLPVILLSVFHTGYCCCCITFYANFLVYLSFIFLLACVFMPSSLDIISNGIMFSGCLSTTFVRLSRQTLLQQYLTNALNNFNKNDSSCW